MEIQAKQTNLRLTTPLGEDVLLLAHMEAEEEISGLFHLSLTCFSRIPDIAFDDIVGQNVTVALTGPDGDDRCWNGIVRRFKQRQTTLDRTYYELEVVPWLWLLTRTTDCRIFQDQAVPDILKTIFDDNGWAGHYDDGDLGSYPERLYCTQYRETAYDFVHRLMYEEGIHFYFRHGDGKHTLVLSDDSAANDTCAGKEAAYNPESAILEAQCVHVLESMQQVHTNKVALQDFNYETLEDLGAEKTESGAKPELEEYDYPGEYPDTTEGRRHAKIRLEGHVAQKRILTGKSNCRGFTAGHRFDLKEHPRGDFNETLLITSVRHVVKEAYGDEPSSYENEFRCVPASVPYRPPHEKDRPFVRGVQTAIVVGPSGEEIYSEKLGRVKVQFHWDRLGGKDQNSSCWVRVSSPWADGQWGAFFLPRIGQEVIVDFVEGDADRPLIVGRVYNGDKTPPYDPETNLTRSTIQTRSSPGGAASNYNEIRFEDKKGEEELYIQAEKDKNVLVKNDRGENVGNNETISIGNDRTENVGNNETISIGNDRTETVGNNETITIASDRTETVGKNETVTVGVTRTHAVAVNDALAVGAAQEIAVGAARELLVGVNQDTSIGVSESKSVGKDRDLEVGRNLSETVGENYTLKSGKEILVDADAQITIQTGKAKIVMKDSGEILIEGTKIDIKASGNIVMKAKKILQN